MKTQQSHNPREWLTSFMDGCHEMALNHLRPHIQKMFENCDIALLEFSEKAQSSTSQIRFMEAGTIIKKYRTRVEAVFYQELQQGFTRFKHDCLQGVSTGQAHVKNPGSSEEQLTLISKEETDIEVAIQNMVASASLGSIHELTAIRQRLAVLNNGRKLQEQQIPAGPVALANSFHKASDELVLEHELKLIVYLLFDKFVLSKTRSLYDVYNGRLLKAGLLQNLKFEAPKNPHAPQQRHTTGQQASPNADNNPASAGGRATGSEQSLGDELFDNILELLSRRHTNVGYAPENPMPQAELVSAIHRLQKNSDSNNGLTRAPAASADTAAGKQAIANMIANLTSEREQLFRGVDRRQLPTANAQMIDLVGMMFEYMLNDDEIPNVAKAELSRLHTPYLKVGIIDKTLFTDNTHPAHELLNGLARASTRWVFEDNLDRGIFPCIRKIVTCICRDFNNDLDIFAEMLGMLHASLHDLRHKALAIEERSRQAAEGREKLELARRRAADNIKEAVRTHDIPAAIRQMIEDVWRDKLMFIYLREPDADQSDSWRLATQTLATILWCVEPRTTTEEQTQLREQCTVVYNQIRQSLETLSAYGASDVASELALIREYTEAAINAVYQSPAPLSKAPGTAAGSRSESVVSADADVCKSVRKEAHQAIDARPESPASAAGGTGTAAPAGVVDHTDGQADNHSDVDDLTPQIAAIMAELSNMPFGTWFRIRKDAECVPIHAKLSWYSGISGNYMFVDSMGIKVAVLKQRELAGLLVSGQAEIAGEVKRPLIRRALEAIRSLLGNEQTVHA